MNATAQYTFFFPVLLLLGSIGAFTSCGRRSAAANPDSSVTPEHRCPDVESAIEEQLPSCVSPPTPPRKDQRSCFVASRTLRGPWTPLLVSGRLNRRCGVDFLDDIPVSLASSQVPCTGMVLIEGESAPPAVGGGEDAVGRLAPTIVDAKVINASPSPEELAACARPTRADLAELTYRVGRADLAPCSRSHAARQRAGTIQMTIEPSGAISAVDIDSVPGLSGEERRCISDRLLTLRTPPYDGERAHSSMSIMSTNFFRRNSG